MAKYIPNPIKKYSILWTVRFFSLQNPNIGTSIMDDTGKPLRAVAVFCAAIKYLRNHLVDALASTMKGVEPNWILENFSFQWIFTHPVNWEDQTKQVITMAAKQVTKVLFFNP